MRTFKYAKDKEELSVYEIAVIVGGSRSFNDYFIFCEKMEEWLKDNDYFHGYELVFISGCASSGADDLIIRYCEENEIPWVPFPANWDKYGKRAGMLRNKEMASAATHLVAFYDGISPGTKDMISQARDIGLTLHTVLVDPD